MTLEEAKKLLEKEGFKLKGSGKPGVVSEFFTEYESPEVCEAMQVVCSAGYMIMMFVNVFEARKDRLRKEYEKNTKAPGSTENSIKGDLSGNKSIEHCGEPIPGSPLSAVEGIKLKRKDNQNTSENPALKESATQFNDALLDEQAKKIAELTEEKERLEDKITIFNIFKKRNDEAYRRQIRSLDKEISKLNGIIHDKNAVLADVAEELRLSKIREKNLTEVCQKYMKENEELKKELDEANKHRQQAYRSCADKNKEIRALKLQISALEKRGNGIDWKRNADAIKLYVNRASHERLWSPISQDICNEQELSFIINHGGKRVKYALRFDGTDIVYECSDPDKKPSFFRDDSVGAVTNQKDSSPVKDTHPTEDNPEEIEFEKAVKLVRKAMKEGRTVTIDYKD